MMEEKYVYVIHYFTMRLDTGEITDKIWLEGNHYYAKQFFQARKDIIDRAVGKKPRIVEFETVSKCLGHSSTQITQMAYSKLLKETIIKEVSQVF